MRNEGLERKGRKGKDEKHLVILYPELVVSQQRLGSHFKPVLEFLNLPGHLSPRCIGEICLLYLFLAMRV